MQRKLTKRLSSRISEPEDDLQSAIDEAYVEENIPIKKRETVAEKLMKMKSSVEMKNA